MWTKFFTLITLLSFNFCNVASVVTGSSGTELGDGFTRKGGIKEDLIHFYRFEETSPNFLDSQQSLDFSDPNGWYQATGIQSIAGVSGNALRGPSGFPTSGIVLNATNSFSFNTNEKLNVSFWLKSTNTSGSDRVFFSSGNFFISVTTGNDLRVSFDGGGSSNTFASAISNDSIWRHYSINVDFSINAIDVYRDANFFANQTTNTIDDPSSNNNAFFSNTVGGDVATDIQLDSFGIWTRKLDSSEIDSLYNNNSGLE